MSMINWNCQGLESPHTVLHLKDLIKDFRPVVVFLMKTKQSEAYCERIRREVGFDRAEYMNPIGASWGLALWWSKEINISMNDKNVMDTTISSAWLGRDVLVTWIYGDPNQARRTINWEALRILRANRRDQWICVGDFNEISHHDEKIGGRRKDQRMLDAFNSLMGDLQVDDLGFQGQRWTWTNNRSGAERICERLDRILANRSWCNQFPKAQCLNELAIGSDHSS